jgi:hypothetical protein
MNEQIETRKVTVFEGLPLIGVMVEPSPEIIARGQVFCPARNVRPVLGKAPWPQAFDEDAQTVLRVWRLVNPS